MNISDCIVVGGGFSGFAAAIIAARAVLRIFLIERTNYLGSAVTNFLVNPFMPYLTSVEVSGEKKQQFYNGGLLREVPEELYAMGGINDNRAVFHVGYVILLLNRIVQEAGTNVLFHTMLTDAEKQGDTLKPVNASSKSGNLVFEADYFIDATGDADLAVQCGVFFRLSRDTDSLCQHITLTIWLARVNLEKYMQSKPSNNQLYQAFQAQGKITDAQDFIRIMPILCCLLEADGTAAGEGAGCDRRLGNGVRIPSE